MNLNGGTARLGGMGSRTQAQLRGEIAYVRRDSFWIEHDDKAQDGRSAGATAGDESGSIILENFGGAADERDGWNGARRFAGLTLPRVLTVLTLTAAAFALGIFVAPLVRSPRPAAPAAVTAAPVTVQAAEPAAPPAPPSPPSVTAQAGEPAGLPPQPSSATAQAAEPTAQPSPVSVTAQAAEAVAPAPQPSPASAPGQTAELAAPPVEPSAAPGSGTDSTPAPVVHARTAVRNRSAPALGIASSSPARSSKQPTKKSPAVDATSAREPAAIPAAPESRTEKARDKPASDGAPKKDHAAPASPPKKPAVTPWVDPWAGTIGGDAAHVC